MAGTSVETKGKWETAIHCKSSNTLQLTVISYSVGALTWLTPPRWPPLISKCYNP